MVERISREELKAKFDRQENFFLIDTLPNNAYVKHHLPGAINIVSDNIIYLAPKLIPDRSTDIVVYCGAGP